MPELPEVETVRRGLAPAMEGVRIVSLETSDKRLRVPYPPEFKQVIIGAEVISMARRGKYLIARLGNDYDLILHLGMSGSFRIVPKGAQDEPLTHDHIRFGMQSGTHIIYNDPRRFGFAELVQGDSYANYKPFTKMGPEPFDTTFTPRYLKTRMEGLNAPIKQVLLDQAVVSGLGNIYVCEALYRAGIHPKCKAGGVSLKRLTALVPHILDVLNEAIRSGGSSLKDHKGVDGTMGYFQHHFDVYDREGQICRHEKCQERGTPCIKRIVQGGRSSFYCTYTQR